MTGGHISTVVAWQGDKYAPAIYEPDGLCRCDPRPTSSPAGECPRCHRLDPDKVSERVWPR